MRIEVLAIGAVALVMIPVVACLFAVAGAVFGVAATVWVVRGLTAA